MKAVLKLGGSLLKSGVPASLAGEVAGLSVSHRLALVHGGGDSVTEIASRLGKDQRFVVSPDGIRSRFTDRETADIYAMVMSGMLATRMVLSLQAQGVKAVSISGTDGALIGANRKRRLAIVDERGRRVMVEGGYTGKVESVNGPLIELLMGAGYVPVISPVALGEEFVPLNIDGDKAASAVSRGVSADVVVFATNVEGLILDGSLVREITPDGAREALPRVGFGMQKKLLAAVEAVEGGVGRALICSGSTVGGLTRALGGEGCTVVRPA